jgi:hypothetical protein
VVVALTNFLTGVLDMRKNVLALSIAAMIGGLGFAGAASAAVITGGGTGGAPNATDIAAANGLMSPRTPTTCWTSRFSCPLAMCGHLQ